MRIIDEIREGFASLRIDSVRSITGVPKAYPAYVIRTAESYGVAIKIDDNVEVSENFNGCKFHSGRMTIGGDTRNYLILSSIYKDLRYEFASICAEFVDPGENGKNRTLLMSEPYKWWERWRELLGNVSMEKRVYNIIAEMLVLEKKYKEDSRAEWAGARNGSHDIECPNESCEVKSTIKRYGATVTISGQHQLEHVKKLWIYFCRMEESLEGISINELKDKLISCGYDETKLELELEKQGLEKGSNIRSKKYKILEKRKYEVNDSFPKIVKESFREGKFPDSIVHIEYTVDLDGIEYTTW